MSYAEMFQLSQQFRANLLRQERSVASQMVAFYQDAYQAMLARVTDLLRKMAQAQASGQPVKTSWLWEEHRLLTLMAQIQREIDGFAQMSYSLVLGEEQSGLEAGYLNSQALMQASLPGLRINWVHLPPWQLAHLVGNLQDGSPLKALFDSLAQDGAQRAGKVLFNGVAAGSGPRVIARQLRDQLSIPLSRALRISRTETIRIYNQAALSNYKANRDVVREWEWSAAESVRTCDECARLNGKRFKLDSEQQPPPAHPNCRCAALPVTYSYDEIVARFAA